MKRNIIAWLITALFLTGTSFPVGAATIPAGFDSWALQGTTDAKKVWTVRFSLPLDVNSVNQNNIYVTDDNNNAISTSLACSDDGNSVQVKPTGAYKVGQKYWLFVGGGLIADNGKNALAQPIAVPFLVAEENSKIILISAGKSSLLTSFTVLTSGDVFSVKINSKNMIYQGNNTYTLGMTGLKTGGTVTVNVYDSKGKSLASQKYTLE